MAETKALTLKEEVLDRVQASINALQSSGELQMPANYSVGNALKSAWLILQNTNNRDGKPVLEACNRPSIINALMSMSIQGLSPDKKQCYFIAYGPQLTLMRSYFGSMAVAMRIDRRIAEIASMEVYAGDEVEWEIQRGKRYITKHKQAPENIDKAKIVGAYAMPIYHDGDCGPAVYMTMDQIKQAWNQGQIKPANADGTIKADSTHGKFTADMVKKTVVNALCKPIINSSNDASLFAQTAKQTEMEMVAAEVEAEIIESERPLIDIPVEPVLEGQQKIDV